MTALDHALVWVRGELTEGAATAAFALALLIAGGLLWKLGEAPASRALVIPLLGVGVLMLAGTAWTGFYNLAYPEAFREAYAIDAAAFLEAEIARVQKFMGVYVYTAAAATVLIAGGLAAFLFFGSPTVGAIGLALIVLGTTALVVDFFSKARASQYLETLLQL